VEVVQSQTLLLEIVAALGAAGRLPSGLYGGEQEGDENANNGDDDQQFYERKPMKFAHGQTLHAWKEKCQEKPTRIPTNRRNR
jgi:hypothetical protein